MTQQEILQHKVEGRILTYLNRVKCFYERALYNVLARGVTPQEFFAIINKLVAKGILKRTLGTEGAPILHWVETEQQQG
jgi:hypothetical protein